MATATHGNPPATKPTPGVLASKLRCKCARLGASRMQTTSLMRICHARELASRTTSESEPHEHQMRTMIMTMKAMKMKTWKSQLVSYTVIRCHPHSHPLSSTVIRTRTSQASCPISLARRLLRDSLDVRQVDRVPGRHLLAPSVPVHVRQLQLQCANWLKTALSLTATIALPLCHPGRKPRAAIADRISTECATAALAPAVSPTPHGGRSARLCCCRPFGPGT